MAARPIFSDLGLDGASVAAVVAASDISTGTFYNYFGTTKAVFDDIMDDIVNDLVTITDDARKQAGSLNEMLFAASYEFLKYMVQQDLLPFLERNQHHVRDFLRVRESGERLLRGISEDINRAVADRGGVASGDLILITQIVISNSIDAALTLWPRNMDDLSRAANIITCLTVGGIDSLLRCYGSGAIAYELGISDVSRDG